MATKKDKLNFEQTIDVPLSETFSAFSSATALTEWLCDEASMEARSGGRLYLAWNSGYYATGEIVKFEPPDRLYFSWLGRGEPFSTRIRINFNASDQGTLVKLSHSGIGTGKTWRPIRKEFKKAWKRSLENLKTVLETGQDYRITGKPIIGVTALEHVDSNAASQSGLPVVGGLRVVGVVEGLGAQVAGIQPGDIFVNLGGKDLIDNTYLAEALREHQVGDVVKAIIYRDGERLSIKLALSKRPLPEIPSDAKELAKQLFDLYAQSNKVIEELMAGVSKEETNFHIKPIDWSIKEILGHLIAVEREIHSWISRLIDDEEAGYDFHANQPVRVSAVKSGYTTWKILVKELKRNQRETVTMLTNLPPDFISRKRSYIRMAYTLLSMTYHYEDHVTQIQQTLDEARKVLSPRLDDVG